MRNPDMVYVLKMEYVSKINIFGLNRGRVKKKYTNGFKSGGNVLGQSASKC